MTTLKYLLSETQKQVVDIAPKQGPEALALLDDAIKIKKSKLEAVLKIGF